MFRILFVPLHKVGLLAVHLALLFEGVSFCVSILLVQFWADVVILVITPNLLVGGLKVNKTLILKPVIYAN